MCERNAISYERDAICVSGMLLACRRDAVYMDRHM